MDLLDFSMDVLELFNQNLLRHLRLKFRFFLEGLDLVPKLELLEQLLRAVLLVETSTLRQVEDRLGQESC